MQTVNILLVGGGGGAGAAGNNQYGGGAAFVRFAVWPDKTYVARHRPAPAPRAFGNSGKNEYHFEAK